ncbi:hypothetical protein AB832_01675 [Flavobacteriaceae bacterium (ex Bugula neritina AB1)]|nr:hypothetical protein AB832_01675 [Flavobacteriaceae bacterium (ex Bugula neritina AB1)]
MAIGIPSSAKTGKTRMRIVVGYNANDGDSSCGTISYGQVEDYSINVTGDSGPTCNDNIQNGDETGIDCGGSCEPCSPEVDAGRVSTNNNQTSVTTTTGDGIADIITFSNTSTSTAGYIYLITDDAGQILTTEATSHNFEGSTVGICRVYGLSYIGTLSVTGKNVLDSGLSSGAFDVSNNWIVVTRVAQSTCTDGIQNGDETGVDCGGSCSPCQPDVVYCSATGNSGPEGVTNVTFAGINNASARNASGYDNFTSISGNVNAGTSYNLRVDIEGYNGGASDEIYAWFDWNIDGDFADAGESYTLTKTTNLRGDISVAVPATAINGSTRMRVLVSYYPAENNPCDTGTNDVRYGEYEDYSVVVSGGAAKSVETSNVTKVYPNPFSNRLTIDLSQLNSGNIGINIYDITGKQVIRKSYAKNPGKINLNDVSDLKPGSYFVRIETTNRVEVLRIVSSGI